MRHKFIAFFLPAYRRESGSSLLCFHDCQQFRFELENLFLKSLSSSVETASAHLASWPFSIFFPPRNICSKCVNWLTQHERLSVPPGGRDLFCIVCLKEKKKLE